MQAHSQLIWVLWKVSRRCLPPNWFKETQSHPCEWRGCSRDTMATTFPSLFSCLFSALRACIMRPWLAWTGSNSNVFYCSVTVWILMPTCPGWPCLTIWKPEGSQSLYIMHDLRVPQSVIPAPNNEWADRYKSLSGREIWNPEVLFMLFTMNSLLQNTHWVTFSSFLPLYVVLVSHRIVYFSF